MGDGAAAQPKFKTELTDYSVSHHDTTGPYAKDLDVDALVVGAGFGKPQNSARTGFNGELANNLLQLVYSCSRLFVTVA